MTNCASRKVSLHHLVKQVEFLVFVCNFTGAPKEGYAAVIDRMIHRLARIDKSVGKGDSYADRRAGREMLERAAAYRAVQVD